MDRQLFGAGPQILPNQLTLCQPLGADYARITTCLPRFSDLPPSLRSLFSFRQLAFKSLVYYCELDLTLGGPGGKTEIRNFHFHAKTIVIHSAAAVR